ncbi:hypothetical protein TCDM_05999 [Trypanosoma cruzi Dm28c]|uniref:Secreted protein n=1 Tax=Trypanosoma cruzi Dm28c TaxID=1416333 RepID=V5AXH7_TRYCR|nr:hypothetical protein TCDM_05999 [Trypanosoma cruzi Dm28c]
MNGVFSFFFFLSLSLSLSLCVCVCDHLQPTRLFIYLILFLCFCCLTYWNVGSVRVCLFVCLFLRGYYGVSREAYSRVVLFFTHSEGKQQHTQTHTHTREGKGGINNGRTDFYAYCPARFWPSG